MKLSSHEYPIAGRSWFRPQSAPKPHTNARSETTNLFNFNQLTRQNRAILRGFSLPPFRIGKKAKRTHRAAQYEPFFDRNKELNLKTTTQRFGFVCHAQFARGIAVGQTVFVCLLRRAARFSPRNRRDDAVSTSIPWTTQTALSARQVLELLGLAICPALRSVSGGYLLALSEVF